jgi:hypothetical protein
LTKIWYYEQGTLEREGKSSSSTTNIVEGAVPKLLQSAFNMRRQGSVDSVWEHSTEAKMRLIGESPEKKVETQIDDRE